MTHHGHWQWKRLPLDLKSAPAMFQRCVSKILRSNKLDVFVANFINDILVFSESYEEHLKHIQSTLKVLVKNGFKLNLRKCKFALNEVNYLSHKIGHNTIRPLLEDMTAVKNFPVSKTRRQVRQFLRKINFHLGYIPKASMLLNPLYNLLRKNVEFTWSAPCQKNFEEITAYLCMEPILAMFDMKSPIYTDLICTMLRKRLIYKNASKGKVGTILKQLQADGKIMKKSSEDFHFDRLQNHQKSHKIEHLNKKLPFLLFKERVRDER